MEVKITSELSKAVGYDRNCLWQEEQSEQIKMLSFAACFPWLKTQRCRDISLHSHFLYFCSVFLMCFPWNRYKYICTPTGATLSIMTMDGIFLIMKEFYFYFICKCYCFCVFIYFGSYV